MARTYKRLCPYCGEGFDLRLSPIVSAATTAVPNRAAVSAAEPSPNAIVSDPLDGGVIPAVDDDDPFAAAVGQSAAPSDASDVALMDSRSRQAGRRVDLPGAHEVLWQPSTQPTVQRRRNAFTDLVNAPGSLPDLRPLTDFKAEQLPRRGCPNCLRALPGEIDHRQLHVLAIVGVVGATKSHFFTSATGLAENKQLLKDLGCVEFEVDAESGNLFYEKYYVPFFKKGETLPGTPEDSSVRFNTITFKVTFEGREPFLLMTHDVSGEALSDFRTRAQVTPFIRRASGVIFLVDPGEFDELYETLPAEETDPALSRRISQGALLGHVLDELEIQLDGRDIPVSIAVTKSDLLSSALGRDFKFAQDSARGSTWQQEIRAVDAEVRTMLKDIGEVQLLQNADKHRSVFFHAVSPAGSRPGTPGYTRPRPVRVEEPLGTVLYAISRAEPRR